MNILNEEKKLLVDTITLCINHNIQINFKAKKSVLVNGYSCVGAITHGKAKSTTFNFALKCSDKYEEFWGAFLHESCHIDQNLDNSKYYSNDIINAEYMQYVLDLYLSGIVPKSKKIRAYIKAFLAMELDCEKRAIKKIRKNNLNIDLVNYVKEANVHLYWYSWMYHSRMKNIPNYTKKTIDKMPKKLLNVDQYWNNPINIKN